MKQRSSKVHHRLMARVSRLGAEQEAAIGLPADGCRLIKGPPGSGKSAVALRRAITLARQGLLRGTPRVLLVGHTHAQCEAWIRILSELAPDVVESLRVTTVSSWCRRFLEQHAKHVSVMSLDSWQGLLKETLDDFRGRSSHPLLQRPLAFFQSEFENVLQFHDVVHLERYRQTSREGQAGRLDRGAREVLWSVYEEFEARRRAHGGVPPTELARFVARRLPRTPRLPFDHVLVDDAHRHQPAELALCHDLAPGGSQTFLADRQSRAALPGLRWSNAGLSFAGRVTMLPETSAHNPHILELAERALIRPRHSEPKHLLQEPGLLWPAAPDEQARLPFPGPLRGARPTFLQCRDWQQEISTLTTRISRLLGSVHPSEIAVITRHRHFLERLGPRFTEQGIPWELPGPDASHEQILASDRVRLLPLAQCAGLSFPLVFLADGILGQDFPATPESPAEFPSRCAERQAIHFAMTRGTRELTVSGTHAMVAPPLVELQALVRVAGR